jgi:UMF1 family MFS transporter
MEDTIRSSVSEMKLHQKAIRAWTMYDWGNSAFATTIMAAVLPVYYTSVAASGLAPNIATAYWGFTSSISALLAAIISPFLGAVADIRGSKKSFLTIFMLLGVTATALLYFIQSGDWLLASIFFIFGNIGFAGSLVYYDALLPHVARPEEMDQVSSRGYAMGYIGGGILLAVNLVMIMVLPELVPGLDAGLMTRLSFVTVSIWWLVFTCPCCSMSRNLPGASKKARTSPNLWLPVSAGSARPSEKSVDTAIYPWVCSPFGDTPTGLAPSS